MEYIKVTDKLPVKQPEDTGEWHEIFMFADGGWVSGYFDTISESFQWDDDYDYPDDDGKYNRVTHWMEKPPNPK